jgi:hypothetical protein
VSPAIVLSDQADGGNDDGPVRRVESDRCLDGRQVVVEVARVDGKEVGKESESNAEPERNPVVVVVWGEREGKRVNWE